MPEPGDVLADGRVDREKLNELLLLGAEQEALDFKATVDFTDHKHSIEHIKDLLALMSLPSGGYLIVGVSNTGAAAEDQLPITPAHFDQATLQQKVASFVDAPVDIRSAVHTLSSGWNVALIYAGPPPELLPLIVKRHGQYTRDSGGQVFVFREGQVIVREGTTTTHLLTRHWPRLLSRYAERLKADARKDVDALVSRVVGLIEQSERGGAAATPIDFDMDLATFTTAADALIESGSSSRLDRALTAGVTQLRTAAADAESELVPEILDRLFVIAVAAMLYGTESQFSRIIEVVGDYYDSVPSIPDATSNTSPSEQRSAAAWRDVAVRLYTLGAEAVRRSKWNHLRILTLHPYAVTHSYRYSSWIRHTITSASRANVLDTEENPSGQSAAVISRALNLAARKPELVPDLATSTADIPTELSANPLLDALCQFDLLWCTVAFSIDRQSHDFFPSSSAFEQRHAYPAFVRLAQDAEMRTALFPGLAESEIAECITAVADQAQRQSEHNPGFNWWQGLPDSVARWIQDATAV